MMIYVGLIYWNWNSQLLRVWRNNKKKKFKIFVDFVDGQNVTECNEHDIDDNKQN